MSLKEKFQVVLNQRGTFRCPNGTPAVGNGSNPQGNLATDKNFQLVVANLKNRQNARPRTIKTFTSTVGSLFQQSLPEQEVSALVRRLQDSGHISIAGDKVSYGL